MQEIGNKLIEIHVTDSGLVAPGAGLLDNLGGMADGLIATPALMVMLIALAVAVPLSILAVVLSRLHHKRTNRTSAIGKTMLKLTPIAAILAIVAAPLLTLATPSPLDNTPISITIDKATALSASDTTTVLLDQDATSHADIYAELDNDFNGYLNTDLTVSVANTNDSTSTTNLSTTNNLIYSTNPVAAGDTTDFQITVSITEDLPVGDYAGQVSFYGDFVQAQERATISFWCYVGDEAVNVNDGISQREDEYGGHFIGKTVVLSIDDTYTIPTPSELGLYGSGCDDDHSWHNYQKSDDNYWYWPNYRIGFSAGDIANAVAISEVSSLFIDAEPQPIDEPWYEDCWLSYDAVICANYSTEMAEWRNNVQDPWFANQFQNWDDNWRNAVNEYRVNNGNGMVFDGLEFMWTTIVY